MAAEIAKPTTEPKADVELAPAAVTAARLTTALARSGARTVVVVAVGTLDFNPHKVARVGPLLEGRVTALNVQVGDAVERHALLGTIASFDVGRARADQFSARAKLHQAEADFDREKKLIEQRFTTEKELLAAETSRDVARVEVAASEEKLRAAGASTKGTGQGASIGLESPLAGHVIEMSARLGQAVRSTDTLFVVGDTRELWLIAEVYERDLARVHAGESVDITVLSFPGQVFTGTVEHVSRVVDPTRRVADVRVVLANPGENLRPGMSVTAQIHTNEALATTNVAPAVLIARGAVQLVDGQPFLFVPQGPGKYEMRAVERGADLGLDVEITRGLNPGETVVIEGAFLLKSQVLRAQMGSND